MKLTFLLLFALFINLNASAYNTLPPDSTSSIIEKGTAKFLITDGKKIYNEGNFRGALVKFREALAKDKNNPTATYWVGECHLALSNYDKALKCGKLAYDMDNKIHTEVNFL